MSENGSTELSAQTLLGWKVLFKPIVQILMGPSSMYKLSAFDQQMPISQTSAPKLIQLEMQHIPSTSDLSTHPNPSALQKGLWTGFSLMNCNVASFVVTRKAAKGAVLSANPKKAKPQTTTA